ncbi:MAG: DUF3108 domain-containing protein [Aestuariivirga sp.]|uniref:DUF3108 domain-containing protein n=1 Tax=Aestuariivirga sp. TaxID=2650926 RepID=UPI0025BEA666|nr:DUF3108 domain-containing protein [Aestuariivirga sp.]MCA3560669.1 DUF3108 domain-containing protein [Aestuariivirga sp.]
MRIVFLGLLAAALAAIAPAAALAAGVTVSYNVDIGLLTVTEVKLSLDLAGEQVHAKARIRAAGVSRAFSEFGATAVAETRLGAAGPEPLSYRITRDQSDKRKVTTLTWNNGAVTYDPPPSNAERMARIDAAVAQGVVDPVTAVLRMGTVGESPCPSTHDVFDGREVFELALTGAGMGMLEDGKSAWKGQVQECSVRWTPVAGRAKDKGVPGDSYDVAFAPVADLGNGRKLWLPVQMSGKLKGLGFTGYLTKLDDKARDVSE